MKIITIDPYDGGDLIYNGSKDEKGNSKTFRYTQSKKTWNQNKKIYENNRIKLIKYYTPIINKNFLESLN